jgi:Ni/Co efflux regulator RcnB
MRQFVAEPYRWPHGYAYHRFVIGRRLARDYWTPDYYIDNYADYGLADPPYRFEWVRYGPDVFLVDLDSGIIGQVVYGVFDESPPPDGE